MKAHLFKLLFMALEEHKELRDRLGSATDVEQLWAVAEVGGPRESQCRPLQ